MTRFLKQGTSGTYLARAPRGSLCGARRDGVASLFTPRPPLSCGRLLTGPRPLASLRVDSRAARAWGGGAEQSGGCRRRGGSVGGRAPAPSSARQAACWAPSLRRRLPGRGRLGLTFPQECNCCEGPERLETRGPPPAARSAAHPVTACLSRLPRCFCGGAGTPSRGGVTSSGMSCPLRVRHFPTSTQSGRLRYDPVSGGTLCLGVDSSRDQAEQLWPRWPRGGCWPPSLRSQLCGVHAG